MSGARPIHFQHLLSRCVLDASGRRAGRIEEIVVKRRDDGAYIVESFLLGAAGLGARLSIPYLALHLLRPLGVSNQKASHRVPAEQMDLSDPRHPKLKCPREELETLK